MSSLEEEISKEAIELVEEILEDPAFKTDVNKMLAKKFDPYVPYVTGALANNITVDANGITYNQPYAEEVYESNHLHNLEQHPLASSHWDEVAFANHEDEIDAEIEERLDRWRTKTKR